MPHVLTGGRRRVGRSGTRASLRRAEDFDALMRDLRAGFAKYVLQPFFMGVAGALGLSVGASSRGPSSARPRPALTRVRGCCTHGRVVAYALRSHVPPYGPPLVAACGQGTPSSTG